MLEIENILKRRKIDDGLRLDSYTRESWERDRERIKALFLDEVFGNLPPKITPEYDKEEMAINFAGKAKWEKVHFTFKKDDKSHTVTTDLILPKGKENIPVFLYISFDKEIPNKYLPVEEIIDNGFGIFTFYYRGVTEDNLDFDDGIAALFKKEREELGFGKIALWSYMAIACLDYLETRKEVGPVCVVGHSRLGKTALLTSALDKRPVMVCSNDSGCSGAAISREKPKGCETIGDICKVFPYWFTKNYYKYIDNECAQPFDHHMLIALSAPRTVMVGGAELDVWADNEGQHLACYLASPIWKLYGKEGLIFDKLPSEGDKFLSGSVTYHQRGGTHFMSRTDWQIYMEKFKNEIRK